MKFQLKNLILVAFLFSQCVNTDAPVLDCGSIEILESQLLKSLNSESINIQATVLKEEIYFKKISCIYVTVVNPILDCLNMQEMKDSYGIKNYKKKEEEIKNESLKYAQMIVRNCNIQKMNDIVFEYGKNNKKGIFIPWFTIHYKELIEK